VNHRAPSDPTAMPTGSSIPVAAKKLICPLVVIRPMALTLA